MIEMPRLRHVDAIPIDTEEGPAVALRDPMGLAEEPVVVSRFALYLLQYFDGRHTLEQICRKAEKKTGARIEPAMMTSLIEHLDEKFFLDNARARQYKLDIETALRTADVRPACHAGVSYPDEAAPLEETLDGFFREGAGMPGPVNGLPTPAGIIAPHIDLRIGGATYSHAYRRIAESPLADIYVILGTGHAGLSEMYSVLPVDFETPLGRVQTDKPFIDRLEGNSKFPIYQDLFLHKSEHTIEFQTIFLKRILGDKPFTIVPILCSFSYHVFTYPQFQRERDIIASFSEALRTTIEETEGRSCTVIASVDLAHVGPRYGDESAPDDAFLERVETADRESLQHVIGVSADGWRDANEKVEDKFRVCGFAPVYTLLNSTRAQRGELLSYDRGRMDDGESVVSYCSAALYHD